jgi:hypothetical protein
MCGAGVMREVSGLFGTNRGASVGKGGERICDPLLGASSSHDMQ